MATRIFLGLAVLLATVFAVPVRAATPSPSVAERLDRAERMLDWSAIARLSPSFVLAQREDIYAVTSILNGCVARACDVDAQIKRLRGPLVSEGVREFSRAWIEYVARDPASARARFEALAREPRTAWLGAFGRLAYAVDARNVSLLRDAIRDARADPVVAKALADDIATAEMSVAALEGDDDRLTTLARRGGDNAGALMAQFGLQVAADDFPAAENTLRRYVRLYGEDQDALVSRLELLQATRPPEEVVRAARSAIEAHPRYWRLWLSLAQALITADDEAGALQALAPDENFPTAFATVRLELNVSRAAFARLSSDEVDAYAQALQPWRDHPEAAAALAEALLDAGRPDEAAALLDRADAMTNALPATLNVRAKLAKKAGLEDEYVRLLERVAARRPREPGPQLMLAWAYVKVGQTMKAARISAALRHSPRYVNPGSLDLLDKLMREAEPSFRAASL